MNFTFTFTYSTIAKAWVRWLELWCITRVGTLLFPMALKLPLIYGTSKYCGLRLAPSATVRKAGVAWCRPRSKLLCCVTLLILKNVVRYTVDYPNISHPNQLCLSFVLYVNLLLYCWTHVKQLNSKSILYVSFTVCWLSSTKHFVCIFHCLLVIIYKAFCMYLSLFAGYHLQTILYVSFTIYWLSFTNHFICIFHCLLVIIYKPFCMYLSLFAGYQLQTILYVSFTIYWLSSTNNFECFLHYLLVIIHKPFHKSVTIWLRYSHAYLIIPKIWLIELLRIQLFWIIPSPLCTYSMQQNTSWDANRFTASQENPLILWNPKVHYRIHKYPPTCPYPEPPRSSPYSHIPLPEEPVYEDFCEILQSALRTKILGFVVLTMAFLTTMYT